MSKTLQTLGLGSQDHLLVPHKDEPPESQHIAFVFFEEAAEEGLPGHWFLIYAHLKQKRLECFDSTYNLRSPYRERQRQWI